MSELKNHKQLLIAYKQTFASKNKIQDPDIRNLFLKNIQLQDKSKSDKKNKPEKEKR